MNGKTRMTNMRVVSVFVIRISFGLRVSNFSRRTMTSFPITTTFTIEGYRIRQYLGVVRGITVRSPTISQGILGGLKSIIGGQIGSYTDMCEQTRQQAYDLLIDHARAVGANAIVGLR